MATTQISKIQVGNGTIYDIKDTTYSAGSGLSLSGTTINHNNSITAGTASGSASKTLTFGDTFTIPTITYDAQGHITGKGTTTMTMPADPNVDTKVTQTATTANADYRILLSGGANDSNETTTSFKNTNLKYNPGSQLLSIGGSITATGNLNITGIANLNSEVYANSLTAGSLLVNGGASFVNGASFSEIPTAPTPATSSNDTSIATTAFVKNNLGGLSGAMHFKGTTTTALSDGTTTAAVTIGGSSYTPSAGDVVLYSDSEFVWTGSDWERLGRDSSFKVTQTTVSAATTASTTAATTFVSAIEQDTNGVIKYTTKVLPVGSTSVTGIVMLSSATNSTATNVAATPSAVKAAYDLAASKSATTGTVTQVIAGTGLSIGTTTGGNFTTSGTINHTNSVTAQATQALYPIKIDAQGHISGYGTAITSLPASDVSAWAKASTKPSYTASEVGLGNVANLDQSKAIKSITRSGITFTYTALDGTTGTFTQQDNNTTYGISGQLSGNTYVTTLTADGSGTSSTVPAMVGASSTTAGKAGLVPAPATGNVGQFLKGDGTWATPTDTKNTAGSTDTSSKIFLIGATSQAANPQTYSDNEVFATSGVLTAKTFNSTSLTASQAVSTDANKNLVSTNLTVSDPSASGTGITYIATISQGATGKITATKSTVRTATTAQTGVIQINATNANSFINQLTTGDSVPTDNDYFISQYVNGGTTTTTYHRRKVSTIWDYVKGKITAGTYWANIKISDAASYNATPEMATIKLNGNTGASAASTSNVSLVYNSTTQALDFVFA